MCSKWNHGFGYGRRRANGEWLVVMDEISFEEPVQLSKSHSTSLSLSLFPYPLSLSVCCCDEVRKEQRSRLCFPSEAPDEEAETSLTWTAELTAIICRPDIDLVIIGLWT